MFFAFVGGGASGGENTPLTKHLLELAGKSKGVCLVPRGGELAFDLAKGSDFLVASQEPTAEIAAAMRAKADQAGLLGRNLYIAEADFNTPVLADNYANLLVIADATDEMLGKLDAKVMLRVLAPYGGKAIVGSAKGATGTLTKANLDEWVKGFSVPDAKVVQDDFGLWATVTKPQLPGSTEWTHRYYRPHNNPVTEDTTVHWPLMTQWLDKPYNDSGTLGLMAGGRVFQVMEGESGKTASSYIFAGRDSNTLVARDAYNGRILWKRPFDIRWQAEVMTSPTIATDDALYQIEPLKPNVLVIDPETGKDERSLSFVETGQMLFWIALEGDTLYALAGPASETPRDCGLHKFVWQDYRKYNNGDTIAALDVKTGKLKWRQKIEKPAIQDMNIGMRAGRIYYIARDLHAACLDAATGKELWRNADAGKAWASLALSPKPPVVVGHEGSTICTPEAIIFYSPAQGSLVLGPDDGKILWRLTTWTHPVVRDGRVFLGAQGNDHAHTIIDLLTGKPDASFMDGKFGTASACGSFSMNPELIAGSFGVGTSFVSGQVVWPNGHRSECNTVPIFSGGLLFQQGYGCSCTYGVRGQLMEASAGDFEFGRQADESTRLRKSAQPDVAQPVAGSDLDWAAFRADNARNGSSRSAVIPAASMVWTAKPAANYPLPPDAFKTSDPVYAPTPPICVGDRIFAGNADGSVRCLQLGDGRELWRFHTSARLFASPTWDNGRLYVGSGDGYVYCLDAASGRELWRFQAAPVERRILMDGQLISSWPITGSVIVENGIAYVWACLLNSNGAHVYALDAKTGAIRWQNNDSGAQNSKALWSTGATPIGEGTITAGRLWIRNLSYALRDGVFGTPAMPNGDIRARYSGALESDVVLTGGMRHFSDQHEPKEARLTSPMRALIVKPDGAYSHQSHTVGAYSPDRGDCASITAMPAWDERHFAGTFRVPDNNTDTVKPVLLAVWDKADLVKYLRLPVAAGEKPGAVPRPASLWQIEKSWWYATALNKNAVVGVYGNDSGTAKDPAVQQLRLHYKKTWGKPDLILCDSWGVAAYDRDTGKPLWDVPLPSEPLLDGAIIARDGSVIIQLLDGSVVGLGATAKIK